MLPASPERTGWCPAINRNAVSFTISYPSPQALVEKVGQPVLEGGWVERTKDALERGSAAQNWASRRRRVGRGQSPPARRHGP